MGRKPISDKPKSSRPLRILLTDEEREILDRAASPTPTSTWGREVLFAIAERSREIIAYCQRHDMTQAEFLRFAIENQLSQHNGKKPAKKKAARKKRSKR